MAKKSRTKTKKRAKVAYPGMMGDGTEEQNLGQRGNPKARIKKKEVAAAFGKRRTKKWFAGLEVRRHSPITTNISLSRVTRPAADSLASPSSINWVAGRNVTF